MLRWGLLASAGAALGSTARYLVGHWLPNDAVHAFPWGTLTVNLVGAAVIGALAARPAVMSNDGLRHFAITGVLGGFTTFSALAVDTAHLAHRPVTAAAYVAVTFVGGVAAAGAGWRVAA